MLRVAAIVEGITEDRFFRSIFPRGCPVIYGVPNGNEGLTASLNYITDKIATLSGDIDHIFVVFDRERRVKISADIANEVLSSITGCHSGKIYVGIPDQMIENWICSVGSIICPGKDFSDYTGDGCNGKKILKSKLGYSPSPTDTAKLLKKANASDIAKTSPSFMKLLNQVAAGTNFWFDK